MNDNDENSSSGGRFDVSSKFLTVLLVVVTAFLIFAGPTYVPYVLSTILNVGYVISVISGVVLLIIGLVLMWFLVRKKIIS